MAAAPVDVEKEKQLFQKKLPPGKTPQSMQGSTISFYSNVEGKEIWGTFQDFDPFTARIMLSEQKTSLPRSCLPSMVRNIY